MNIKAGKNPDKDDFRWAYCPNCGAKTKVGGYFDTVMLNFPLYCSKCKTETLVDVVQFKMVRSNKSESS